MHGALTCLRNSQVMFKNMFTLMDIGCFEEEMSQLACAPDADKGRSALGGAYFLREFVVMSCLLSVTGHVNCKNAL